MSLITQSSEIKKSSDTPGVQWLQWVSRAQETISELVSPNKVLQPSKDGGY